MSTTEPRREVETTPASDLSEPAAVMPQAVEFLCVAVALIVVDGVDSGEEVKFHPPTASFISLILVATALNVVSHTSYCPIDWQGPYCVASRVLWDESFMA